MRIKIVIPVVRTDLAELLLEDLSHQTLPADWVFVIDNSEGGYSLPDNAPANMTLVRSGKNLGVNTSWNLGIALTTRCDAVSILNDDIRVGRHFLKMVATVLTAKQDAGVVCPNTANGAGRPPSNISPGEINPMRKREGWAMTIRRAILDEMPAIPSDRIRTFCGDDWIWHWSHRLGYVWYKDISNKVTHQVGVSMLQLPDMRAALKSEKEEYKRIIAELDA